MVIFLSDFKEACLLYFRSRTLISRPSSHRLQPLSFLSRLASYITLHTTLQAQTTLPAHETYHLGLVRDEETLQPKMYLNKLPAKFTSEDRVLVTDPMLATGGSMLYAIDEVCQKRKHCLRQKKQCFL
jgi:hypothetical protein